MRKMGLREVNLPDQDLITIEWERRCEADSNHGRGFLETGILSQLTLLFLRVSQNVPVFLSRQKTH